MPQPENSPLATISIITPTGLTSLPIAVGTPTFILGGNGTGKSSLVHSFNNQLPKVVYLPGARPSFFDNEGTGLTPESRRQLGENLRGWDSQPDNRWRSVQGTSRNAKAIHDLIAAETQFKIDAANEITREGASSKAIARLQAMKSPLDRVNQLLKQGNLPVRVEILNGDLKARRGQSTYSYAKMSDGERIALILCSEIIAAPPQSFLMIDEPELHLHRSIVVPLLDAVMSERRDCAFIISTHELALAARHPEGQIVLVREYIWAANGTGSWKIDVLPIGADIPDDLLVDILGSRDKLLFVEGTSSSLDQPLYAILFPSVSVITRSTCSEVVRAVSGLRSTDAIHHAKAFGLIDNDGMNEDQLNKLEANGVFGLPVHNVESLCYSSEVISAVAEQQANNLSLSKQSLIDDANAKALSTIQPAQISHLAARLIEQKVHNEIMKAIPKRDAIIEAGDTPIQLTVEQNYVAERSNLEALIANKALDSIIARYSVRHSNILNGIANGLRFLDREDYEKAALTKIATDSALTKVLKLKLEKLASALS